MAKITPVNLNTRNINVNGQTYTIVDSLQLVQFLTKLGYQVDAISMGSISGTWNAAEEPPTASSGANTNPTGSVLGVTWSAGDYVRKITPVVFTGTNGKQYVLKGWICTVGGNVGTANPPQFVPDNTPINP